jgi:hypothetical protein
VKLLNYISYFVLIITFGIIITAGYWLLYPYNPIAFNNLPFKVVNKTVKTGDTLIYIVDYCKYNTLIPDARKTFVDQIIYSIPAEAALAKETGCHIINIQINVPTNLPPGSYVLKITYYYQVNPIRTVDVSVQTEQFNVIK